MRIAVPYENDKIFQHFGHTERFKVYEVEEGEVKLTSVVNTNGTGHGALADLLRKGQVDTLICGVIGGGAKARVSEAGITLVAGATGDVDRAVEDFLRGKLEHNENASCSRHGGEAHGHSQEGCSCGH